MEKLVALLPAQYVMSTTLHDRLVHLQLLKRLRAQPELQVLQPHGLCWGLQPRMLGAASLDAAPSI